MYKLILILTFLFNFNSKANEFNFVKTEIQIKNSEKIITSADFIEATDDFVTILKDGEFYFEEFENHWERSQFENIFDDFHSILSMKLIDDRFYLLLKFNDNSQQLFYWESTGPRAFEDFGIYPKFKFGGDTIIEPNRLVKLRDSILIAYSTKENESNKYQFHRFGFEDGLDKYDYAVKGLLQGDNYTPKSKFKDITKVDNFVNKTTSIGFLNDSTQNVFWGRRDLYLDYQTLENVNFSVRKLNYQSHSIDYNQIIININSDFTHVYLDNENEKGFLFLAKDYFFNSSPNDTIKEQIVIKVKIDSEGNDEDIISLEIPFRGEYISDVYDYNNTLMFLIKENEKGNVNIYYSKDDGDTWNFEETPELNNSETLEMCYYNNQIYAYNKDNIFVTDFISSVENNINESSINAYANNSSLFVKSTDNDIRQITLIDILGNELYYNNFNNQKELKIPVNLTNYNLLICKVTTHNEVKVLKLIKGEN